MGKQLLKRSDVDQKTTWDLSTLFKDEQTFLATLDETYQMVVAFNKKYAGTLNNSAAIVNALNDYQAILLNLTHLSTYVSLAANSDQTDETNVKRQASYSNRAGEMNKLLSFLTPEIKQNDESILAEVAKNEALTLLIKDLIREKPHSLSLDMENTLAYFNQVFDAPYSTYLRSKLADMTFEPFEANGEMHPQSFVLFENEWEYEADTNIRRAAYDNFYQKLAQYQNTFASVYQTKVLTEKSYATLKGFDSVIDYLLFPQKVTREMYDRQIDLIMEKLAPAMRKFVTLLKDIHGLDKLTYADLKIEVDDQFEPKISIEESKEHILKGLSALGDDYLEMIHRAYDERWIDFPQNLGKSTGAFCSSPYGAHPFILISWTQRMREVFVLAHELGHAGHFYLAGQNQNIYNVRPSLYFIEAPSTMNEMIVANKLISESDDLRFKRWVLSSMISRTYYHNFVTHLLEAAYQRDVYRLVDAGKPITASVLNNLKLNTLKQFWGDTVEIPDYAGLTWMRQPHYYMGLYPYTYSAGLTIATVVSQKIIKGELDVERWKDVLKAGGTKDPVGLAAMVDVDLTTSEPLLQTIDSISGIIDEIIDLTKKLDI